jgi:hypothetical protein
VHSVGVAGGQVSGGRRRFTSVGYKWWSRAHSLLATLTGVRRQAVEGGGVAPAAGARAERGSDGRWGI